MHRLKTIDIAPSIYPNRHNVVTLEILLFLSELTQVNIIVEIDAQEISFSNGNCLIEYMTLVYSICNYYTRPKSIEDDILKVFTSPKFTAPLY